MLLSLKKGLSCQFLKQTKLMYGVGLINWSGIEQMNDFKNGTDR